VYAYKSLVIYAGTDSGRLLEGLLNDIKYFKMEKDKHERIVIKHFAHKDINSDQAVNIMALGTVGTGIEWSDLLTDSITLPGLKSNLEGFLEEYSTQELDR
jgi:hypothetical protein